MPHSLPGAAAANEDVSKGKGRAGLLSRRASAATPDAGMAHARKLRAEKLAKRRASCGK